MGLSPEFLEKLACPKCGGPVRLEADARSLTCAACRLAYDIVDDIPNFIVAEARTIEVAR